MKRFLASVCALAVVVSLGCANCNCSKCRRGLLAGRGAGGGGGAYAAGGGGAGMYGGGVGPGGGGMPAVAYPYYTTRGPRDFLAKNPRGIGP